MNDPLKKSPLVRAGAAAAAALVTSTIVSAILALFATASDDAVQNVAAAKGVLHARADVR